MPPRDLALRRALMACLAWATCACGDTELALTLDGVASVVLIEGRGDAFVGEHQAVPLRHAVDPAATVWALGYTRAPDDVPTGTLFFGSSGRRLPAPDRVMTLTGSDWTALDALPPELSGLRFDPGPCAGFRSVRHDFPSYATFLVPLDRERLLAGTRSGELLVVTGSATRPLVTGSTLTPHLGAVVREGEVFLVGPDRRFARGHPDRGFARGPDLVTPLVGEVAIAASPAGAPLELFVVDVENSVQRFDGERWRIVREPTGDADGTHSGLAWIGPGSVVLIGAARRSLIELVPGRPPRELVMDLATFPRQDGLRSIATVPPHGVLIGTELGVVLERDDGGWTRWASPEVAVAAEAIVPLGEGRFVLGGEDGVFIERGPSVGDFCPALPQLGVEDTLAAAPWGDGFAVISGRAEVGFHLFLSTR